MIDKNIVFTVTDRQCTADESCNIICGNGDYTATFTFDSEWNKPKKYARFAWNNVYCDVEIPNGKMQVKIPVITETTILKVGVYSDDMHTTTPAYIRCTPSILCESGFPMWL